jgi:outer membrane protein assembly factor BamB
MRNTDFLHFRANLQRTGLVEHTLPPPLTLAWERNFGDEVRFPSLAGDRIYFCSLDANAYCLSLSGETVWTFTTGARNNAGMMLYRGRCYFGSNDHGFYCLDAETGAMIWRRSSRAANQGNFAAFDDVVCCGSYDGCVYAFDAVTGQTRWTFDAGSGVNCSLAVLDSTIYFGANGGTVHAVDARTGRTIWETLAPGGINSTCAVSPRGVFTGTRTGQCCAFDVDTGALLWSLDFGARIFASPALDDAFVYIASDLCTLRKLNIDDGSLVWEATLGTGCLPPGGQIWTSPVIAGDVVYAGPALGAVQAVDRASGALRWSFPVAGPASSSVAVGQGMLFTSTGGNHMLAFKPAPQARCS